MIWIWAIPLRLNVMVGVCSYECKAAALKMAQEGAGGFVDGLEAVMFETLADYYEYAGKTQDFTRVIQ